MRRSGPTTRPDEFTIPCHGRRHRLQIEGGLLHVLDHTPADLQIRTLLHSVCPCLPSNFAFHGGWTDSWKKELFDLRRGTISLALWPHLHTFVRLAHPALRTFFFHHGGHALLGFLRPEPQHARARLAIGAPPDAVLLWRLPQDIDTDTPWIVAPEWSRAFSAFNMFQSTPPINKHVTTKTMRCKLCYTHFGTTPARHRETPHHHVNVAHQLTQILTRLHFRPSYLSRTFATISPQLYP